MAITQSPTIKSKNHTNESLALLVFYINGNVTVTQVLYSGLGTDTSTSETMRLII